MCVYVLVEILPHQEDWLYKGTDKEKVLKKFEFHKGYDHYPLEVREYEIPDNMTEVDDSLLNECIGYDVIKLESEED